MTIIGLIFLFSDVGIWISGLSFRNKDFGWEFFVFGLGILQLRS